MHNPELLSQGISFLHGHGLNLFCVLSCRSLPNDLQQQLAAEGIDSSLYPSLVLLGNGGGGIWQEIQAATLENTDPVDEFSSMIASQFIADYLGGAPSQLLYPGPTRVSLMQLGNLAGWSHPSPLGLGIHAEYGLWFAYRAAFVTSAELPPTTSPPSQHPCESCVEKPCITACPVGAVSAEQPFNISTCYEFRLTANSPCVDRCLSRLACPVGQEHRYSEEQMRHHYALSRRVS